MRMKIISKLGFKVANLNRRKAIKEKCNDCSGWSYSGVKNCSFIECNLYPYRTGEGKQKSKERNQAIRNYCKSCVQGSAKEVKKCTSKTCPLYAYRLTTKDKSVILI